MSEVKYIFVIDFNIHVLYGFDTVGVEVNCDTYRWLLSKDILREN